MTTETIRANPSRRAAVELLRSADLPSSDLTDEHMEHFLFCGPEAAPTGLVGIELCGRHALLRSLVVSPASRSAGIGSLLVEHAEGLARSCNARSIYLLTTTAEAFFGRRGYVRTDRENAPPGIRATPEFSDICPASSAFMVKEL